MEKLILKNGFEIEIHEGASLGTIVTDVVDYDALEAISAQLTPENLTSVRFMSGEDGAMVTGVYDNMTTSNPKFLITEKEGGSLEVTFGLRERSIEELRYEELAQQVTDMQMALCEVYESMS